MKKEYQKPSTLLVKMETEGDFLMDSAHSTQHEGSLRPQILTLELRMALMTTHHSNQ